MLKAKNIELIVFDMAGTVVNEGGLVYAVLRRVLEAAGASFTDEEFDHWHGANKIEVVRHFLDGGKAPEDKVEAVFGEFLTGIKDAYFSPSSTIAPIDGAIDCFQQLRGAGIKVGLDTGYPRDVADHLIEKMAFGPHIDGSIVSEEVGAGRPWPFMIHGLMKQLKIMDVRRVAKCGDTARDMEEGNNAGCGLVVGVLSGADKEATLMDAGAHVVLGSVAELVP